MEPTHPNLPIPAPLVVRGRLYDASRPAVMAILNRTRDSFYESNRNYDFDTARRALDEAVEAGADIIDVGGVRAGQDGEVVDGAEEIRRVVPFLEYARSTYPDLVLSLDTWRSEVAAAAEAGIVDIVNDAWAAYDPRLVEVAADRKAAYVVTHTGGLPPRTDPVNVSFGSDPLDVMRDVLTTLHTGASRALEVGIPRTGILLDPALDFGKTTRHSLTVVRHTSDVVSLGFPVLQAISRKKFIGESLDLTADQRLEGTLAATAISAWQGATVFRAHDVRATRRVLDLVAMIRGDREPVKAIRGEPLQPSH